MPRTYYIGTILLVVPLIAGPARAQSANASQQSAKQAARMAAGSWLADIDDGDFDDSWEAAASVFQARVSREAWEDEGRRLRDSVQTGTNRTVTMVKYRDSLGQAGEGPFVVLKYRSSPGDPIIQETVVTVRENTTWKVAGYQVTVRSSRTGRTLRPSGMN